MLWLVALSLVLSAVQGAPEPVSVDDLFRTDLQAAVDDSQTLADELAAMLARLEDDTDTVETDTVVEVLEKDAEVETALEQMIGNLENLANLEKETENGKIKAISEDQQTQTDELKDTLNELKEIAKEIEIVASEDAAEGGSDPISIEKMAKTLQEVSERIKGVEEAVKPKKESKKKTASLQDELQNNKVEIKLTGLFDNIFTTSTLNGLTLSADDESSTEESSTEETSEATEKESVTTQEPGGDQKPRGGKSLDDGLTEEAVADEGPKEECEEKLASDRVQICTPGLTNKPNYIQFYIKNIKQDRHCVKIHRVECAEVSQDVTKEVCYYQYQQKTVVAPAFVAQLGLERRFQNFHISECKKDIVKDGYHEKEVENCYLKEVQADYRLPTVSEHIEDFVELSAPVPEKKCRVIKYEIPEVECEDKYEKACVSLSHLEADNVRLEVSEVVEDYQGNCDHRNLEQSQQICTVEEKVKRQRGYASPRGYGYSG